MAENQRDETATAAASTSLDVQMEGEEPHPVSSSPSSQEKGEASLPMNGGMPQGLTTEEISNMIKGLKKEQDKMTSRETQEGTRKNSSCCVGIDLGAQNTVIASSIFSSPFSVSVDVNALANRSTPSTEAFDGKLRLIGEEAESRASSNQKNTIFHLPMWIGVKKEEDLEKLKKRLSFTAFPHVSFSSERAEPIFDLTFNDESTQIPLSVVLSYYLRTLVSFAGSSRGHAVKSIGSLAIGVPSTLQDEDMSFLQDICALSDFPFDEESLPSKEEKQNQDAECKHTEEEEEREKSFVSHPVLLLTRADALLNCWACRHLPQVYTDLKNTGIVSTQKKMTREEEEGDTSKHQDGNAEKQEEEEVYVALVDVGFAETSVQVISLKKNDKKAANEGERKGEKDMKEKLLQDDVSMKRLSIAVDPHLGTLDAINALSTHVVDVIRTKHKEEIQPHTRKALRLFTACQRAVKDLSGLPDTNLSLEGFLQDEVDFSLHLSRDQFEQVCSPLKERLSALVKKCLTEARVSPNLVAGMDLVGGGSRIPWVSGLLGDSLHLSSSSLASSNDMINGESGDYQGSLTNDSSSLGSSSGASRLRRTLDGSSSVAVGAAFAASGLSYVQGDKGGDGRLEGEDTKMKRHIDKKLKALNDKIGKIEREEISRQSMRNSFESYLLQMKAAFYGPHKDLLRSQKTELEKYLTDQEHWLLDHPDAPESEYKANFDMVKKEMEEKCASYFEAVEKERERKEEEINQAARDVASAGGGEDMDVKLPNSQCLKRAKKNKDEGNELFKDGNTEMAIQRYIKAIQYTAKLFDLSPQDKAEADALKLACNLNLAQAYIRLSSSPASPGEKPSPSAPLSPTQETFLKKAVSCCDAALETDSTNLKAVYRRALANEKLRDFDAALADVKKGLVTSPEDTDLLKLKERVDRQVKLQKDKAKKMYAKMFS
ncbi:tetratricopeptide repeat-containing protein [Cystoisospora suis]|uniref:Tetratricopeptide repeat-containing protein n=1 Tax=Cystoisospora suis TaxID=483139 RepID=A0A2C6KPW9_9APIC|nr:tetratricopeptide repeat-containing protein [Cystoisospora suis]